MKNENPNYLLKKIKDKNIVVGVIGLGYVGLPLSILISKKKIQVYGFDKNREKIKLLKKNKSYLKSISDKNIQKLNLRNFAAHSDYEKIDKCNIIIICVPTPLYKTKKPNVSYIKDVINSIISKLQPNTLIILESTSYPGTTEELIVKRLNKKFEIGKNFFVSFSPERINPGRNENSLDKVPKIISGKTKKCLQNIKFFYQLFFKKLHITDNLETAEFTKLLENIYRSVNIGFVNEMKYIAEKLNIDIYDAIMAAKTKPYGFRPFLPGPGVGGHCIPIDPYFLLWRAKKFGAVSEFIKLSGRVNEKTQERIIKKIQKFLKNKNKKKFKVLIVGVAYKKNVDDVRESAALKIMSKLRNKSNKLYVYDNYVSSYDNNLIQNKIDNLKYKKNYFDCSVILTDHDHVDYNKIYDVSKKIFDTRFVFKKKHSKVERL